MNKKLIAIAIAGTLAAPLAAQAADISMSGDAQFRYANTDNSGATMNAADNRVRFALTADLGDGVKVATRYVSGDADGSPKSTTGANSNGGYFDYAYIQMPIGPVTATVGDQKATWGTGFQVQNARLAQRIKLTFKAGPATVGLLSDGANDETVRGGSDGVFVVGNVGGFKVGVINKPAPEWTNFYLVGPAGPVNLAIESDDLAGKASMLVQATMGFGSVTGILAHATADAGNTAASYFSPISTLGTSTSATALTDFGALAGDHTATLIGAAFMAAGANFTALAGTYEAGVLNIDVLDVKADFKVGAANMQATYGSLQGDVDYTAIGVNTTVKF